MTRPYLTTADLARAAGVHPNTVRLYEEWGFLPPVPRSRGGYRMFTQEHLDQMCLARLALHGAWPGKNIRESALELVRRGAAGDLGGALDLAYAHLALVQAERARANAAADHLERWAQGVPSDATARRLQVREVAELLDVTADMLRNWERNGLLKTTRDPRNRYRLYGPAEIGRLRVIRMLLRAGYGTMAILRMLLQLDAGNREGLRQALDTPRPDEDIHYATSQWLSTLAEQEDRARRIIDKIEAMLGAQSGGPR